MHENGHDARYLPVLCKVTVALFNGLALQGTEHVVPFVQLLAPQMSVQLCCTIIWRNVRLGFHFFSESYCGTVFLTKFRYLNLLVYLVTETLCTGTYS